MSTAALELRTIAARLCQVSTGSEAEIRTALALPDGPLPLAARDVTITAGPLSLAEVNMSFDAPTLTRADLDEALGDARELPRTGAGAAHVLWYDVSLPDAPAHVAVFARFFELPDPGAPARTILLRIDPVASTSHGAAMRTHVGGRIEYGVGNPQNPGNPFGRIELTLGGDGSARLVQLRMGGAREEWRASIDPAVLMSILETLAHAGFPRVPVHPVPAGTTFRELTVVIDDDHRRADVAWHSVADLPGYREAFSMLDSIVGMMSQAWTTGTSSLVEGAVRDIVRIAG